MKIPWITIMLITASSVTWAATYSQVQTRIDQDISQGKPIVIHLNVALCDNLNQGIVPVPKELGNGQHPKSNLYWGALYGIRTHLPRKEGWKRIEVAQPNSIVILERVLLTKSITRAGKKIPVYIVADAWDGAHIKGAIEAFLCMTAGQGSENVTTDTQSLPAGGNAHLIAFVGHNGLMDFSVNTPQSTKASNQPKSAMILACASKSYFTPHLVKTGAHPTLLTTGLMAPEAYTLASAIEAWVSKKDTQGVVEAAASAYHEYQKCGMNGARRLFWSEEN